MRPAQCRVHRQPVDVALEHPEVADHRGRAQAAPQRADQPRADAAQRRLREVRLRGERGERRRRLRQRSSAGRPGTGGTPSAGRGRPCQAAAGRRRPRREAGRRSAVSPPGAREEAGQRQAQRDRAERARGTVRTTTSSAGPSGANSAGNRGGGRRRPRPAGPARSRRKEPRGGRSPTPGAVGVTGTPEAARHEREQPQSVAHAVVGGDQEARGPSASGPAECGPDQRLARQEGVRQGPGRVSSHSSAGTTGTGAGGAEVRVPLVPGRGAPWSASAAGDGRVRPASTPMPQVVSGSPYSPTTSRPRASADRRAVMRAPVAGVPAPRVRRWVPRR